MIVFTGGEATLRWKDLLEGIRYATELGFLTRLVTNAHWANREDMAQEKLLALIEAGGVSDFLCVRRFSPEVSFSEPA